MFKRSPILLSGISGCLWAGLAYLVGHQWFSQVFLGGMIAAPVIGVLAGLGSKSFSRRDRRVRVLLSLVSLYGTAALFGLAMGILDLAARPYTGPEPLRFSVEILYQPILGVLWGLTFTGYFLLFWPLAYVNHALISKLWGDSGRMALAG